MSGGIAAAWQINHGITIRNIKMTCLGKREIYQTDLPVCYVFFLSHGFRMFSSGFPTFLSQIFAFKFPVFLRRSWNIPCQPILPPPYSKCKQPCNGWNLKVDRLNPDVLTRIEMKSLAKLVQGIQLTRGLMQIISCYLYTWWDFWPTNITGGYRHIPVGVELFIANAIFMAVTILYPVVHTYWNSLALAFKAIEVMGKTLMMSKINAGEWWWKNHEQSAFTCAHPWNHQPVFASVACFDPHWRVTVMFQSIDVTSHISI